MTEAPIIALSQRHAQWLMARQKAVADNIAHAASPGYRATDVRSFSDTLDQTTIAMSATSALHFSITGDMAQTMRRIYTPAAEVSHSGNTVSLNQQFLMANEVRQGYALNSGIARSLHRLMLAAVKG